jgi:predicted transcriptional regulator
MTNQITTLERSVLESLRRGFSLSCQIAEDTGLKQDYIKNILSSLLYKGFVSIKENSFFINKEGFDLIRKINTDTDSLSDEVKEVSSSIIDLALKKKRGKFSLRKAFFTSEQMSYLKEKLQEITNFIEKAEMDNSSSLAKQSYILWGVGNYDDILTHISDEI